MGYRFYARKYPEYYYWLTGLDNATRSYINGPLRDLHTGVGDYQELVLVWFRIYYRMSSSSDLGYTDTDTLGLRSMKWSKVVSG